MLFFLPWSMPLSYPDTQKARAWSRVWWWDWIPERPVCSWLQIILIVSSLNNYLYYTSRIISNLYLLYMPLFLFQYFWTASGFREAAAALLQTGLDAYEAKKYEKSHTIFSQYIKEYPDQISVSWFLSLLSEHSTHCVSIPD